MDTPRRHVFLTFLGTGAYQVAAYTHGGRTLTPTRYAALAELEGPLAEDRPSQVYVVATKTALERHGEQRTTIDRATGASTPCGEGLLPQLRRVHAAVEEIPMTELLSTEAQWGFFEQLLAYIQPGDAVSIDMTHGFRATPIVLSSALHFLRIARGIELRHVFYAVHDAAPPAIVDYREFYAINEWTEAVGRLVDDADARRLATLSRTPGVLPMPGLSAGAVPDSLMNLTAVIRDVDIQNVARVAAEAIRSVEEARREATGASALLLDMVLEKFGSLVGQPPASGRYDAAYFSVQLALVELLLAHGLNMQAFTTLRECVGSLGLHVASGLPSRDLRKVKAAKSARWRADAFGAMLSREESTWKFEGDAARFQGDVLPWFRALEAVGVVEALRGPMQEVQKLRNGFDHAWTTETYPREALGDRGRALLAAVRGAVATIEATFTAPPASAVN